MASSTNSDHPGLGKSKTAESSSSRDNAHWDKGTTNTVAEEEIQFQAISAQSDKNIFNHRSELTKVATKTLHSRDVPINQREDALQPRNTLAEVGPKDTTLDPCSPDFDVYKWAKMTFRDLGKANVKLRHLSFSFRNLHVSGSSTGANFQSNVASVFMMPFRIRGYFSSSKKPETLILSHFDGVVKPGELLLVLGCPGSGCSTFLKIMAGELSGLKIDKSSDIHYSGIFSIYLLFEVDYIDEDKVYHRRRLLTTTKGSQSITRR